MERAILLSVIAIALVAGGQNAASALGRVLDRVAGAMTPVADPPAIKGAPPVSVSP